MTFGFRQAAFMAGAAICAIAKPVQAQQRQFNIEAQDARTGIPEFARQARVQISAPTGRLQNTRTNAVRGTLDLSVALRRLIQGTGLNIVSNDGRMIILYLARPSASSPAISGATAAALQEPFDTAEQALAAEAGEEATAAGERGEEIVVTGTNIRGLVNKTAPVTVLDKDYIDRTGVGTATRLIETLPQNFALANQSANGGIVSGTSGVGEQGSGINLRGIGEGTTLVLLNGRRLPLGFVGSSVDISALPLTAVERVEILTDGASALYGSDAVGGVVNFVLSDNFEGLASRARFGMADGLNEYRLSQTAGAAWSSGRLLVSGEYYKRDALWAEDRSYVPEGFGIGTLLPRDKTHGLVLSGRQNLVPGVTAFGDLLYSHRDSFNEGGQAFPGRRNFFNADNQQVSAALGFDAELGGGWAAELVGNYGDNDLLLETGNRLSNVIADVRANFAIYGTQLKLDGPLFEIPGGTIRSALGASWRHEKLKNSTDERTGEQQTFYTKGAVDQKVGSLFGEISVPLVGDANQMPVIRRMELSLAGRYDRYSTFGSSFDPRVGVALDPVDGLRVRGSYGTSFVAPKLFDYDRRYDVSAALPGPDPEVGGFSNQLRVFGVFPSLEAQKARSFSLGLELRPALVSGLSASTNFYSIKYKGQIAGPPSDPAIILGNPAAYDSLIVRNPSAQLIQEIIAYGQRGQGFLNLIGDAPIDVFIDHRRRNLASVSTQGLDFSARYDLDLSPGALRLALDGVYIFNREQRVTETSAEVDLVDTYNNPPDLRLRGNVDYRRGGFSAGAFINYTDAYRDNRFSPSRRIRSFTTVDARLSYDFGDGAGLARGASVSLSVENLFDEEPPSTEVRPRTADLGFDGTNASPLGQLIALEVSKRW